MSHHSREQNAPSHKNQMSVKLTARGNRREGDDPGSRRPTTKGIDRLVWNSGDPTGWNSQAIVGDSFVRGQWPDAKGRLPRQGLVERLGSCKMVITPRQDWAKWAHKM
ncbi:hypothetical protein PCH_Pc21g05630 [Penicillium rubens Wisconsin 54-1255]|uniref:Uncharacterized protein n=1 Tax=Penicillium rubens (strain ATCC 28089 / DSM 1075 / NRRL 1951 / Wisconsin 54-1255) TaxID=500485 RepID=B6HHZ4_PENRW|nr:hypothetical protein PCH_Pc21g05630 [Penicillium rubens Wisconsin 54-1255]